MLHSNWLSLGMEGLICQCNEPSVQAIRRRQAAMPVSSNGRSRFLTLEDDPEIEALKSGRQSIENKDPETILKVKPSSRTRRQLSMGRPSLKLSTPPRDLPHFDTLDVPCVVSTSFISKIQDHTTPQSGRQSYGLSSGICPSGIQSSRD